MSTMSGNPESTYVLRRVELIRLVLAVHLEWGFWRFNVIWVAEILEFVSKLVAKYSLDLGVLVFSSPLWDIYCLALCHAISTMECLRCILAKRAIV